MLELRGFPAFLTFPVRWPDPNGEFFGYDRYGLWLGGDEYLPGTRILLNALTLGATAAVVLETGFGVGSKEESIQKYKTLVTPWGDWLDALFARCKMDWHYQIPKRKLKRRELAQRLSAAKDFENHLLEMCRPVIELDGAIPVKFY